MDLPQQQTGKFYLKWPWNVVVYVALALLLRIFSIPVILLLMAWNKKQQPDGPEEGYCLQRTRRQLARLGWALLYLLIAACCGVVFFMQLQADRSAWRLEDWAVLAVSGVVAFGGLLLGVYETCTDLRDAFFPERSRLARSIRSQLPYSDEAPDVKELFAMVDRDIRENGQWFDRVAVGREWVLGDDVSAISRIRVVFGRDEIKTRISKNRRQTTRIIELHILDDRRQVQITSLRNPGELEALLACLKLRAPAALFRPYQEFSDYSGKSEEEWATLERAYQRRLTQRQMETVRQEYAAAQGNPAFAFTDSHGQRTSRFDRRTVEEQLSKLQEGAQPISLEILEPIPVPGLHGARLVCLYAGAVHGGLLLTAKMQMAGGGYRLFAKAADMPEIQEALAGLLERRQPPDFSDLSLWKPLQAADQARQSQQKKLVYADSLGATREFTSFSQRDVELVGEGLTSGRYTAAALYAGAWYLYLQAGDRMDGRITVNADCPGPDGLRVFEIKCTSSQAKTWLLAMNDGTFAPDFSQWKDITKRFQKQADRT